MFSNLIKSNTYDSVAAGLLEAEMNNQGIVGVGLML